MLNQDFKAWARAALIRALRTFAQAFIAAIGTTATLGEIDWVIALSTAGCAALLSILTSVAGLPEVSSAAAPDADDDQLKQ